MIKDQKIVLVPLGEIESRILRHLAEGLEKTFGRGVEVRKAISLSDEAFNPGRGQYSSTFILAELHKQADSGKQGRVLAVVDVDLYAEGLNFVFGEAELGGQFALISGARLRQSFYGLKEDESLFLARALKEAVHELGHAFGLSHCPDPDCVMFFSNSLLDTDKKSASFCKVCRARLEISPLPPSD